MTLIRPSQVHRLRLDELVPKRPKPRKPDLARILAGRESVPPSVDVSRLGNRRGLIAALSGLGGSPAQPERAPHRDPLLVLVQRITQGFNLAEYERARTLGYDAYLEEQLAPETIDDSAMDARLASYTTLAMSPRELYDNYSTDNTVPYFEYKGAMLWRSVHSKRQLLERMMEFWNDHFSIDQNKADTEWLFMPDNDRLQLRPNALGSFPAVLSASAHGNAMLFYLDNWLNVQGSPQENYARELLELHSLGVHGGYSEVDVQEVAKCFTGWTLNGDGLSPDWLRGTFAVGLHVGGAKFVLGNTIPAQPPRLNAQRVIDLVAAHPSTADFLGRKLIRWFLTPTPPQALVDQVTATYLLTNGDIKAMLRVILARENMRWAAPIAQPKFRRPFHLIVSLLRTLDAQVDDPLAPLAYLYSMGHVPFDHVQPNGYPDTVEAWGSSLLPRWTFLFDFLRATAIFGQPLPGVSVSLANVKAKVGFATASDRPGLAQRINAALLGGMLLPREVTVLQDYIEDYASFGSAELYESIALGAAMPGFQWY